MSAERKLIFSIAAGLPLCFALRLRVGERTAWQSSP